MRKKGPKPELKALYSSTTSLPCLTLSKEVAALVAIFARWVMQQFTMTIMMVTKRSMKVIKSIREMKDNIKRGEENISSLKSP